MLKYIQTDPFVYEVIVESSNKLIGHFITSDDGFYYFSEYQAVNGGLWSDYALFALANKLKELNKPWRDQINIELSN